MDMITEDMTRQLTYSQRTLPDNGHDNRGHDPKMDMTRKGINIIRNFENDISRKGHEFIRTWQEKDITKIGHNFIRTWQEK